MPAGLRLPAATSGLDQPAPVALPGRRRLRSSAGGPRRLGGIPSSRAWAARVRSTFFVSHQTALSVGAGLAQFHPLTGER